LAAEQFSNNGASTLVGALSATGTTLTVASASSFPTVPQFRIRVDDEIMIVTGVAGAVFTVTRHAESTTAATHAAGAVVQHPLTAAGLLNAPLDAANIVSGQLASAREHMGAGILLCLGFTPAATGSDVGEVMVPYDPADGVTSITWNVRRIWLRVNVAGGAPVATVNVSSGTGAFSGVLVGTLTMGSGNYEVAVTASLGTVASGNKLGFSVTTLATATGWTIGCEIGT